LGDGFRRETADTLLPPTPSRLTRVIAHGHKVADNPLGGGNPARVAVGPDREAGDELGGQDKGPLAAETGALVGRSQFGHLREAVFTITPIVERPIARARKAIPKRSTLPPAFRLADGPVPWLPQSNHQPPDRAPEGRISPPVPQLFILSGYWV